MRIAVTGATGFLGSHLCRRLVRDGHEVTVLRRPSSDTSPLDGLELSEVVGDVTDAEAVLPAVERRDAVVHAAAHLRYWRALRDEQNRVNVEGSRTVAVACAGSGVRRLVHVSSVAAIGIPAGKGLADETFAFNLEGSALNYHVSKKRAEDEVLAEVDRGLDAVIVNPGSIYGRYQSGFRGAEVAARVRRSRVVPCFVGGNNVVHVDDVVEGILAALRDGRAGERYILGGENLTWRRMAEIAAEEVGVRRLLVPVPRLVTWASSLAGEAVAALTHERPRFTREVHLNASRFLYYDSGKAERELGYRFRPYREIVREYLAR